MPRPSPERRPGSSRQSSPHELFTPQLEHGEESETAEHEPEIGVGRTEEEAQAEHGQLRRQPQIRQDRDREAVVVRKRRRLSPLHVGLAHDEPLEPPRGDRVEKAVLRREHGAIDHLERAFGTTTRRHRLLTALAMSLPVERRQVEVHGENDRERQKRGEREPRVPRNRAESGEERCVHDEIGLGVEVPARERHTAGHASELAVRIVEQRLQLQEQRGENGLPARKRESRSEAGCCIGEQDGRWGNRDPMEPRHERVRHGLEGELEDDLPPRAPRFGAAERTPGRVLRGDRHPLTTIVDTAAVAPEGWSEVDGALERTFQFGSFVESLAFVSRVGELAEAENHHPDIAIHYSRVTLRWWTHTAGGITDRDRDLAAKTDGLAAD